MVITEITEEEIFCYHDYEFIIFNINAIVCGKNEIGVVWAGGKCKESPLEVPPSLIKVRGSCYESILFLELLAAYKERFDV